MKKTAKEIADRGDGQETKAWLSDPATTLRELFDYVYLVAGRSETTEYKLVRTMIEIRISEAAETTTRRIVRLTYVLVALTVALLVFTVYLYKDTHALIQREKKAQNDTSQKQ